MSPGPSLRHSHPLLVAGLPGPKSTRATEPKVSVLPVQSNHPNRCASYVQYARSLYHPLNVDGQTRSGSIRLDSLGAWVPTGGDLVAENKKGPKSCIPHPKNSRPMPVCVCVCVSLQLRFRHQCERAHPSAKLDVCSDAKRVLSGVIHPQTCRRGFALAGTQVALGSSGFWGG